MCGRELGVIKQTLAEGGCADKCRWILMDSDVTVFEKELGAEIGADNVVALLAGTAAVHLSATLPKTKTR